jgi:glycerol kinase
VNEDHTLDPKEDSVRKLFLIIDLGTTQVRACLVELGGPFFAIDYLPLRVQHPQPGWAEQDPEGLWQAVVQVTRRLLASRPSQDEIVALALTNQRATVVVWEKQSGKPVYPAITWQDRRKWAFLDQLESRPLFQELRRKAGVIPSGILMANKLRWILDNVSGVRKKVERGELLAGTLDTWILWKMTGGRVFATDYTNATITGLCGLRTRLWDPELMETMHVPLSLMAGEIKPSATHYGDSDSATLGIGLPIAAVAADQHAAMLGYGCISSGQAQATMGTGTFFFINTGEEPRLSASGLTTRVGFGTSQTIRYALEGMIIHTGTAIEFLRDLGILSRHEESAKVASSVPDTGGVYFIPALSGLGAPLWDEAARGGVLGLTRATTPAHVVRACLEAIGYQIRDIIEAVHQEMNFPIESLNVGGGVARNDFVLQFLADITGMRIRRAANSEATVMGTALLAGLTLGMVPRVEDVPGYFTVERTFEPQMNPQIRQALYEGWQEALGRVASGKRRDLSWQ